MFVVGRFLVLVLDWWLIVVGCVLRVACCLLLDVSCVLCVLLLVSWLVFAECVCCLLFLVDCSLSLVVVGC